MGFLKVELKISDATSALSAFKESRMKALEVLHDEVKASVTSTLNQLLHAEMALFLGSPEQQDNKTTSVMATRQRSTR